MAPLLVQEDFRSNERKIKWRGTGKITEHWFSVSKPKNLPEPCEAVVSDDNELSVSWGKGGERVRLMQSIELPKLADHKAGYVIEFRAKFAGDFSPSKSIDWVAILFEESEDHLRFITKINHTLSRSGGVTTIHGTAGVKEFNEQKPQFFCIQFGETAGKITIKDIKLMVVLPQQRPTAQAEAQAGAAKLEPVVAVPNVDHRVPARFVRTVPPLATGARQRVVIIAWDLAHNPVGRAYLLADVLRKSYDVVLIGPVFARYGSKVWAPLAKSEVATFAFHAESMDDFVAAAVDFVKSLDADIVYACKARLPSIFLALLIKHKHGCPVVLDVDDHELSFFKDQTSLTIDQLLDNILEISDLRAPFEESWTRLCESLIPLFDQLTVSNVSLQQRFGGTIVRHARNEDIFKSDPEMRARVRTQFGYDDKDKIILFLGTPRAHKGIFRLADALERLNDKNLVLCVIGAPNDKRIEHRIASYAKARIDVFPDQPWDKLPELIHLADGVCLLQDETSPVSKYQIPAKLTDAISVGVPVAVTDVAPFSDIPETSGVYKIRSDQDLDAFISNVASGAFDDDQGSAARSYFESEMSYAVALDRLSALFEEAGAASPKWPAAFSELLGIISRRTGVALPEGTPNWASELPMPAVSKDLPIDIAFFWKQNDTGIYGRRHDMLIKYLAKHERVGRIIQFDAPIAGNLINSTRFNSGGVDQTSLVIGNTLNRFLNVSDKGNVFKRVFVHASTERPETLLGRSLPPASDYPEWVRTTLRQASRGGPLAAWVAPVVFDYPAVHDEMGFDFSVADLIDDQRPMATTEIYRDRVTESYAETLKRVNLVFANCEAAADAFSPFRNDIRVVRNAAENYETAIDGALPDEMRRIARPIVGYVGNLRDRIDVVLLDKMSRERPDWSIVLIGSAHGDPEVLRLRGRKNIHFLGVKPYEHIPDYVRGFDVAIMPHVHNAVSAAMNPLKLYVYSALGVPVVTTDVPNILELKDYVNISDDHVHFIKIVADLLQGRRSKKAVVIPYELTWRQRVDRIVAVFDAAD